MQDHIHHLTLILQLLDTHKFFVKESKCVFPTTRVSYLGHLLEEGTVAPDLDKIKAIIRWPKPTSLTTLRAFLGITGFYRKFIINVYMEYKCRGSLYKIEKYPNYDSSTESSEFRHTVRGRNQRLQHSNWSCAIPRRSPHCFLQQ